MSRYNTVIISKKEYFFTDSVLAFLCMEFSAFEFYQNMNLLL